MNVRFICALAAGCLWGALPVIGVTAEGNPYAPVVIRNVFGLVPIPVVDPNAAPADATPPPKITPNGIMTIFGKLQVLFKVAGTPRAGQPPKDESYVLGEGERQDEIEVQKIDEASATITFNNHGKIQSLPLVVGTASAGASPAAPPNVMGRPQLPGIKSAPGAVGANPVMGFGGRPGRAHNAPGGGGGGGAGGNPGLGSAPNVNERGIYSPAAEAPGEQMTPEQRILLIEAQRSQGGPHADLLPPTPITEDLKNEAANQ